MIPFYIFYSMFGFQRTGDSIWAMADQLARGFLIGATAGRTTLTGEGLQHADGHSPLLAATNPAVVHYDPAFAYEISHIMQSGLERMYGERATQRERHLLPHRLQRAGRSSRPSPRTSTSRASSRASTRSRPPRARARGCSCSPPASASRGSRTPPGSSPRSGASRPTPGRSPRGTSWPATPSRPRSGTCCTPASSRARRTSPTSWPASTGPVVAVSDYMRAVPLQIARWVPGDYRVLGADGFGFADTRPGRAAVLPHRRPVGGRADAAGARRRRPDRAGEGREAFAQYRIDDPTAVAGVKQEGGDA